MELKKYVFELNIDESVIEEESADIWGAAFLFNKVNNTGVEYNYCNDFGLDSSAIYKTKEIDGVVETDYSTFIHYEIDFSDKLWKEKLKIAMYDVYLMFQ